MGRKTHTKRSATLLITAVAILSTVFGQPTFAADAGTPSDSESILLSPTDKRYQVDAGSAISDSFKIINDGKTTFSFVTYARPYSIKNENYTPDFTSKAQNADAYRWVQFEQTSYTLEPGKSVDVKYSMRVPQNATPGGHYGVLFAETQPQGQNQGASVLRTKRVGAIMYATVKGDVRQSGKIVKSDVGLFQSASPIFIRQSVENTGNTDFTVTSGVRVYDILGKLKYRAEKDVAVLPSTTRSINNDWSKPAWIGVYRVEQQAKFLDTDKTTSNYVVFVPVWVYLALGILIGGRVLYALANRKSKK